MSSPLQARCASLAFVAAMSCLAACDPSFTVPVEVRVSSQFQEQWTRGFPAEVSIRYASETVSLLQPPTGQRLGVLCRATADEVQVRTELATTGCLPADLEVQVWVAPLPAGASSPCTASDGFLAATAAPETGEATTSASQGIDRTSAVKASGEQPLLAGGCKQGAEPVTLSF